MKEEFFVALCPGAGTVSVDGNPQGRNRKDSKLHVFQCGRGLHDIAMHCALGKKCRKPIRTNLMIAHTDPVDPFEVVFECGA